MPHTLAHIGAQTLGTRVLLRDAEGAWILAACVVPDVPWILNRVLDLLPGADPYALALYATAQACLLVSLVLCGALSALATAPRRAFAVLSLGTLLHLLLDALQTKFGNGVHLFAPFSWKLLHFDLFTPESLPTLLLTLLGAGALLWLWRVPPQRPIRWQRRRAALAGCLLLAYVLLPLVLRSGPERADAHSIATLRDRAARPGRSVSFDRNRYVRVAGGHLLHTWAGEDLLLVGAPIGAEGVVSLHGRFLDEGRVAVREAREHPPGLRDGASLVGLLAIGAYGLRALRARPAGVPVPVPGPELLP